MYCMVFAEEMEIGQHRSLTSLIALHNEIKVWQIVEELFYIQSFKLSK